MSEPTLFRTYPVRENASENCTIWEAIRATTAAPAFFEPIEIGVAGMKIRYVDGGLGCNNPITQVLAEAHSLWPDRKIASIVSIGAGRGKTIALPVSTSIVSNPSQRLVKTLHSIATDCERAADICQRRFGTADRVYARLNVDQGMQDILINGWDKLGEVKAHTQQYLVKPAIKHEVDDVVKRLRFPTGVVSTTSACKLRLQPYTIRIHHSQYLSSFG